MKMRHIRLFIFILCFMAVPVIIHARVVEVQILKTELPAFNGTSFGEVGQYEKITGIMKYEIDPKNPLNREIVNIAKAPVNSKGFVEFDADFIIYKPVDMKKGNHKILFDTPNRGGMITFGQYNSGNPGNGFLMKQGYTIVSVGWQAPYPVSGISSYLVGLGSRMPEGATPLLKARLPIAKNADGSAVTGISRELSYTIPDLSTMTLPDGKLVKYLTYPAATLDKTKARLTVRTNERTAPVNIDDWEYIDQWRIAFRKPAGFDGTPIYEFTFTAKEPVVYGLGFTAIRDCISFLRYKTKDDVGNVNPLRTNIKSKNGLHIKKAYAHGYSQTGRLIKTFVIDGFNEDEKGKMVFDGIVTHVGASRKNWLNGQFSHPGDLFGYDQFPFTYATLRDHFTGVVGSNLDKCKKSNTCPKIMHTDSESELWESGASLLVTNTEGTHDIKLPNNVRAYLFTGVKHWPGGTIDPGAYLQLSNPLDYTPLLRAVLVSLDKWVSHNIEPPATRYPTLADGSLVALNDLQFPNIPAYSYQGYNLPAANYHGVLGFGTFWLDYNVQPPARLGEYNVSVMKVDEDGNGVAGIRLPAVQVPIGTYTGWNPALIDRLGSAHGAFYPFKATKAERLATGDPRLSLEERYPTHKSYVDKVEKAARDLVRKRFLLEEDAQKIIDAAAASMTGN